jgi:type IV secretion system protein TrbI
VVENNESPGTAPIVDHRRVPRGVLPRGIQTWLMVALAIVMLFIIFLTGRPEGPSTPKQTASTAGLVSADRVKDYQDRLRQLDEQLARQAREAAQAVPSAPRFDDRGESQPPVDPVVAERRRREFESLFASNVVLSRRPESQQPDASQSRMPRAAATNRPGAQEPSIDDIAAAVVRAGFSNAGVGAQPEPQPSAPSPASTATVSAPARAQGTAATGPISVAGSTHRLLEGTVIDAVLTNRLDGSTAAPVNCLVTNAVYSHSGQHVLIPAGARVLGETRPVQSSGETRLAVSFHRLLFPDGSTVPLDGFRGLNQIGDAGLRDRVNQHYWSTFGAAGAVGLVSGLAQLLGSAGLGLGDGNRTVVVAGSAGDATAQASTQVMNRFLNRLPTITIREGHRVKIYITSDLELPEWTTPSIAGLVERRQP